MFLVRNEEVKLYLKQSKTEISCPPGRSWSVGVPGSHRDHRQHPEPPLGDQVCASGTPVLQVLSLSLSPSTTSRGDRCSGSRFMTAMGQYTTGLQYTVYSLQYTVYSIQYTIYSNTGGHERRRGQAHGGREDHKYPEAGTQH